MVFKICEQFGGFNFFCFVNFAFKGTDYGGGSIQWSNVDNHQYNKYDDSGDTNPDKEPDPPLN